VHVVGANVGTSTPLLAYTQKDGTIVDDGIRIAFDRFLNPSTVNRQGIGLRDLNGNAPDSPIIDYDPITRVVTISNPNPGLTWLVPGQQYEVLFPIATAEAGSFGLRAIDGAPVDPSTQTIGFSVTAVSDRYVGTHLEGPTGPPVIHFCSDVMPIFAATNLSATKEGACGSAACHGIPENKLYTASGLVLDTSDGIRNTAIGVPAEETTTGALSTPLAPQAVFSVGMPIIDPGNPGNSYLLYKLLKADNGAPDASGATVPYTACVPTTPPFDYGPGPGFASPDEAARLAELIPGRRMPWGDTTAQHGPAPPLTIDEMERIRLWILEGAQVDDCTTCGASQ